jgi:endonuclease-3
MTARFTTSTKDRRTQAPLSMVAQRLSNHYGDHGHYNKRDPFDELLFILCSVRTNERKYLESYRDLKRRFPTRRLLSKASEGEIAAAIRRGGLSGQKAFAIRAAIERIEETFGKLTLSPLRRLPDADCETFLTSLPYVGKKVARCIMMCALQRCVFPVDVHVWRIAQRLGLIRASRKDGSCSQRDMDRLQQRIPTALRYALHVNLISLGRDYCRASKPLCGNCPLVQLCPRRGVRRTRPSRSPQQSHA